MAERETKRGVVKYIGHESIDPNLTDSVLRILTRTPGALKGTPGDEIDVEFRNGTRSTIVFNEKGLTTLKKD